MRLNSEGFRKNDGHVMKADWKNNFVVYPFQPNQDMAKYV